MISYQKELDFAKDLAKNCANIVNSYYRQSHNTVEIKDDHSPVTVADKAVNSYIIEQVKKVFPEDGVLGEEETWNIEAKRLWVCDPIDGTVAFIHHIPTFMVAIALVIDGNVVVSVTANPSTNDLYWAEIGKGAFRNGKQIYVSKKTWGPKVTLLGDHNPGIEPHGINIPSIAKELTKHGFYISNPFGGIFKGGLIAGGSVEGRIVGFRYPHDVAAVALLIIEAGGKVTDTSGNPQDYSKPLAGTVMSNGLIHNDLINLYKRF